MFMQGSIGGAVALGVAAAGIALLAPALVMLGNQSWVEIVKGLVTLAAALAILGIAAIALTPAIPAMLGTWRSSASYWCWFGSCRSRYFPDLVLVLLLLLQPDQLLLRFS